MIAHASSDVWLLGDGTDVDRDEPTLVWGL